MRRGDAPRLRAAVVGAMRGRHARGVQDVVAVHVLADVVGGDGAVERRARR